MLGHETEIEQGKILGVGVLDGNELSQHVLSVSAESGVGRDGHEALEALEQNRVGAVLDVARTDFGAHSVMGGDEDFAIVLHEGRTVGVLLEAAEEPQNGHLQERILDSTYFVLGVEVAHDLPVNLGHFGHQVDNFLHVVRAQ